MQDPTGAYITRWVPELSALPSKHIHTPWLATPAVLQAAGVQLGVNYPLRCTEVPLDVLRTRNVAAVRDVQRANPQHRDSRGYDIISVPKVGGHLVDVVFRSVYTYLHVRCDGYAGTCAPATGNCL